MTLNSSENRRYRNISIENTQQKQSAERKKNTFSQSQLIPKHHITPIKQSHKKKPQSHNSHTFSYQNNVCYVATLWTNISSMALFHFVPRFFFGDPYFQLLLFNIHLQFSFSLANLFGKVFISFAAKIAVKIIPSVMALLTEIKTATIRVYSSQFFSSYFVVHLCAKSTSFGVSA